MKKATAVVAGMIVIAGGMAMSAAPASAQPNCGPITYSPGGLTANITCSYVDGAPRYQVIVECPNYGRRYGPIKPVGQPNYAACLSSSAGEGPVQAVYVQGKA